MDLSLFKLRGNICRIALHNEWLMFHRYSWKLSPFFCFRVVGGFEALTAMENVDSDPKTDRPKVLLKLKPKGSPNKGSACVSPECVPCYCLFLKVSFRKMKQTQLAASGTFNFNFLFPGGNTN